MAIQGCASRKASKQPFLYPSPLKSGVLSLDPPCLSPVHRDLSPLRALSMRLEALRHILCPASCRHPVGSSDTANTSGARRHASADTYQVLVTSWHPVVGYPLYLTSLGKKYWNMCLSSMYGGGSCPRPHTVEIKPTRLSSCTIWPVPVVADNYAYIVVDHQTGICGIVDPGAGTPVSLACFQLGLIPRYIFLTHGHHDHAGGVEELVQQYPCIQVFCGEKETVLSVESKRLKDLSIFRLGRTRIVTVETPCHTPGSVVFGILRVFPNNVGSSSTDLLHRCEAAFTGDTLFLGGIGATFHGSDVDMWRSLQRLKHLPASCLVFPGHEYTESLRWFGAWLDPGNEKALMLAHEAQALRTVRRPTVPGVMGLERKVNPWLRLDETAFVNAVTERLRQYQAVPCCARMWTCMNYAPAAWYDITTPLGGRPESTRQSGEIKEMSMHVLPPLIRRQKQGADTPLRPLEHPASSSANYLSGRLDQKHVKSEKSQLREESVPELYWKLRYLQPLFEGLIPSRHFHLKGRSAASLAIQLQTESMVW
eukprot:CAMPEP_0184479228 /NCGR_PEP_ID=MMETSP0113_2-20130426/1035_1 /TAXON_ID=91329 /ORGANISM="Norrisiella sphaerica, Strain BC52" /LENGTH=537 /DNA_ID=CAMNT_0026857265 /DNA_START=140 /DNA_END=1751 /DNA_ORIENTATION=-